jgi:hypothetical protein
MPNTGAAGFLQPGHRAELLGARLRWPTRHTREGKQPVLGRAAGAAPYAHAIQQRRLDPLGGVLLDRRDQSADEALDQRPDVDLS